MAKQCSFFSAHTNGKGDVALKKHNGYDDGDFYYYGVFGTWYVIDKPTGLSIVTAENPKQARKLAHSKSLTKKLEAKKKTSEYKDWVKKYSKLLEGVLK